MAVGAFIGTVLREKLVALVIGGFHAAGELVNGVHSCRHVTPFSLGVDALGMGKRNDEQVPRGQMTPAHNSTVMSRTELIIQLLKVALGLALGAYFVWWSLEVLHRLPSH
jgi:hypothetical protein